MTPLTKKYSMKSITGVLVGAAPLGVDPMTRLRKLLMPNATFTQVYGMTETSCVALRFYHPEDDLTGSIGRPVPNIDVKYDLDRWVLLSLSTLLKLNRSSAELSMMKAKISQPTTQSAKCVCVAL